MIFARFLLSLNAKLNRQLRQLAKGRTRWHPGPAHQSGFTLIELLIAAIISSIIVLSLLSLVVEMVSTNRREMARSETQRDMGIAAEYMSSELREAAYVYPGDCLGSQVGVPSSATYCPGLFGGKRPLSAEGGGKSVPILAFWKLDPLPDSCNDALCSNYEIAGRTYSLVVYFLEKRGQPWAGRAQLTRAELARFNSQGQSGATPYLDPTTPGTSFRTWPFNGSGGAIDGSNFAGMAFNQRTNAVLVDYVDDTPDATTSDDKSMCPDDYKVTPSSVLLSNQGFPNVRSIYACVRDDTASVSSSSTESGSSTDRTAFNQKVVLFIRGNPDGRYGMDRLACGEGSNLNTTLRKSDNPCKLAAIKTEVLNRGVANKVPNQL